MSDLVKTVKTRSSAWLKDGRPDFRDFYWQDGYAAFSASPLDQKKIVAYIRNQEEHHKLRDFHTELELFLNKYKVPYDREYL